MATSRVALDPSQYVRVNYGYNPMIIEASEGEVKVCVTENQPATTNLAFHRVSERQRLVLESIDANVWVLATTTSQKAVVTELPDSAGVSTYNVSTNLLGASETFTGTAEINNYADVGVSCHSSSAGTLYFDFSNDGTNWNTFPVAGFVVAAGIHEFHTAVKLGRYFRCRFVNSASAQTYFRLYTYFGQFRVPSAPMNQSQGLDADATMVRPTWTWMDISRGLLSGVTSVKKFGRNPSVGTSYVPITVGGHYEVPTIAKTIRVKAGGNANDIAGGTGARVIEVEGLDENYQLVEEDIVMNGANASTATTTTFTRFFRAYVNESGTYASATAGSHAGPITVEYSDGSADVIDIDFNGFPKGQSEVGAYTIPAGKTGFVKLRDISIDSGKTVDVVFFFRPNADVITPPYSAMRAQSVVTGVAGGSIETFGSTDVPFGPYIGPTDVGFMAKVASGTASVSVEFEIILIDE